MADGGGGHDAITSATWFSGLLTIGGAFIGAGALWLAQRVAGKAAWQQAINSGFAGVMEQQRILHEKERAAWRTELDLERGYRAAERAQHAGEIINLTQSFESLKAHLSRRGIEIPSGYHREPQQMIVLQGESREL